MIITLGARRFGCSVAGSRRACATMVTVAVAIPVLELDTLLPGHGCVWQR